MIERLNSFRHVSDFKILRAGKVEPFLRLAESFVLAKLYLGGFMSDRKADF